MKWYEIKAMERSHKWTNNRSTDPMRQCVACSDNDESEARYCTGNKKKAKDFKPLFEGTIPNE